MDEADCSDYLSSCDSLYSVDSVSSGDDDGCEDLDAFLSDSMEDEADLRGGRCELRLLSPDSGLDGARSPGLLYGDHECRTLRPAGQTVGRHQPKGYNARYPELLENGVLPSVHTRLAAEEATLPDRNQSQKKPEGGLKRLAQSTEGEWVKRQRTEAVVEEEARWRRNTGSGGEEGHPRSEGDRIFAQKCKELQGFIKPLLGLLNGLKRGRYEKGLSSFQQSVAMDRIQRIVGVLQKPEMGERYLGTLLQVEMMLKVWFPRVPVCSSSPPERGVGDVQDRSTKHSCTNCTEIKNLPGQLAKHPDVTSQSPQQESPSGVPETDTATTAQDGAQVLGWSALNLTWMHTSPICNPPLRLPATPDSATLLSSSTASCGVILFLHNNLLTCPARMCSASVPPEKSLTAACPQGAHPSERRVHLRSQSVPGPGAPPGSSSRILGKGESHITSLLPLPETGGPRQGLLVDAALN
ncbi:circadian-associated transcriptional repressor [Microcaecilia unicolor]|uniref:Circadian-associated transcriptional repressor n=1 Tax=Microcaecilia unicolor TaxID=1415580 RepID=A0A6P7X070_9AMPH|nr:circadian-associated transcriptional repressor [Microcaecilia unicolor]